MAHPTVLYPLTLPGLLHHVLATQRPTVPTTMIVCSSRDAFLGDLEQSLRDRPDSRMRDLLVPTLHNLSTSRHVTVAFCATVQGLLAYLTVYGAAGPHRCRDDGTTDRLLLVNPLALHAQTSSFSAQGLSRTFATAIETALKTGVSLQVIECQGIPKRHRSVDEDVDMDLVGDDQAEQSSDLDVESDPWDQEVSILNVSARKFGSSSNERAWAGRTVKAKRIAARWFHFCELHQQRSFADQVSG